MLNKHQQSGFSLIETLIALTVFSVGFIGVAQFTGVGLKATADNNAKAVSLSIMTQKLAPLYLEALKDKASFATEFNKYITDAGVTVNVNNNTDTYVVKIIAAVDDAGANLLAVPQPAATTWVSPISVSVGITGAGVSSKAPYTFLLTEPTP